MPLLIMTFKSSALRAPCRLRVLTAAIFLLAISGAFAQATQPPVVISGTRFADEVDKLPFGVSVLTARDIERSGATTVNEAISRLLGVPGRVDFYGGGDYALDLRGFGGTSDSNQVVMVDGVRINEGDVGGTRLAGIAIDSVERIEVLRGGAAVLYGEGATGGAIIITIKAGKGVARANQGRVYAGVSSFNSRDLRSSVTLVADAFSLDLAANKRQSDNHRDNFKSDVQGGAVTGHWRHEGWRVALGHAQDELSTGLPGSLSSVQYAASPRQTTTPDNHASIRNARSTLRVEFRQGSWEGVLDVGVRDKALRSVSFSSGIGSPFDTNVEATTYALRASHRGAVAGLGNSLVFGLDAGDWARQGLTYASLAKQRNLGFYARDELTLAGGTRLSVGLRSESVKKDNQSGQGLDRREQVWELGVVQPVTAELALFARLGNSFRLANADEYSYAERGGALRPQTSRDAELGARWRKGGTRAELRAYRSSLVDEIGFDPVAFGPYDVGTPFGANVNFDPTRRQGLELDASQALSPAVQLRTVLALRDARFMSGAHAGKKVSLTTRRTVSVGMDWQVAAEHRLSSQLFYASQRHPDFDNLCAMPSYVTLDLRYAFKFGAGDFSLGVANATDRRYFTQAFRCVAGVTEGIYPEAGRSLTGAVRWQF